MRKVYITGLGFITSIGNDAAGVSESLRELRHGIVVYPPFQKPEVPVKVAAPVRDFQTDTVEAEDWVMPARYSIKRDLLRGMAPHGVYAYCAMQQAVEDAKLTEADWSNPDTGLYAASGGSPFLLGYYLERMRKHGVMRCQPLGVVACISGTVNFNLVSHFKIKGASTGFSSACASSAHALGFAYDEIMLGRQKRMFVVGAEDGNVESILPFAGMRALSVQTDPSKASRPFDSARDGFVGTGGATVVVLESEEEVERRNAKVYCPNKSRGSYNAVSTVLKVFAPSCLKTRSMNGINSSTSLPVSRMTGMLMVYRLSRIDSVPGPERGTGVNSRRIDPRPPYKPPR